MSDGIEGKVVVITGASSGLGEAAARYLSARGASVVLGARRVDRLQSAVDELTKRGISPCALLDDSVGVNHGAVITAEMGPN